MSQLQLVWELEEHSNLLDDYIISLNNLAENLEMLKLKEYYNKILEKEEFITKQLENNNKKIIDLERKLKNLEYTLKEMDKSLYESKISDLKQINYILNEKEKNINQLEKIETEILGLFEENDQLDEKKIFLLDKKVKCERRIKNLSYTNIMEKKDLLEKINIEKELIIDYKERIEKDILNRYEIIKKNKKNPIVEAKKYICGGCHMYVSTSFKEILYNKKEIVYCEYCGRILYYIEE